MRHAIEIVGTGIVLEVSKLVAIKTDSINVFHLDKLKDGTWKLTYNSNMIPDLTKVECLKIVRED